MNLPKPCLTCGVLTTGKARCEPCRLANVASQTAKRGPRPHYGGKYQTESKRIRQTATTCWLCGQGARPDDPWQADHVNPGQVGGLLAAAHRSCNIARSNAAKRKRK